MTYGRIVNTLLLGKDIPIHSVVSDYNSNKGQMFVRLWNFSADYDSYLIISKYQPEIFIIVGNFNKEYEEHIRIIDAHKLRTPNPVPEMMEMQEYGPFHINKAANMKKFARHIVAY
jgi:hypothetical protein